ncbi:MAG TPA: hypothetical protein VMU94_25700 [Streptosporangiaceae bacterium]|nr:hypothetical protein [Streptosporangiaceae bacterium]
MFAGRRYKVRHVISEGDLVAAYLRWTANPAGRRARGGWPRRLPGRLAGGLVTEDRDAFVPAS